MELDKLVLYPTRFSNHDLQALRDRAQIEQIKPTVLVRKLVRDYLTKPSADSA